MLVLLLPHASRAFNVPRFLSEWNTTFYTWCICSAIRSYLHESERWAQHWSVRVSVYFVFTFDLFSVLIYTPLSTAIGSCTVELACRRRRRIEFCACKYAKRECHIDRHRDRDKTNAHATYYRCINIWGALNGFERVLRNVSLFGMVGASLELT